MTFRVNEFWVLWSDLTTQTEKLIWQLMMIFLKRRKFLGKIIVSVIIIKDKSFSLCLWLKIVCFKLNLYNFFLLSSLSLSLNCIFRNHFDISTLLILLKSSCECERVWHNYFCYFFILLPTLLDVRNVSNSTFKMESMYLKKNISNFVDVIKCLIFKNLFSLKKLMWVIANHYWNGLIYSFVFSCDYQWVLLLIEVKKTWYCLKSSTPK